MSGLMLPTLRQLQYLKLLPEHASFSRAAEAAHVSQPALSAGVQELEKITSAYLQNLQQRPALVRALYLELLTLGPQGLAMRRRISERFTQFLIMQEELSRVKEPGKRSLSPALATATVGGINELIVQAIEEDRADRLGELQPTISDFVRAVLHSLMPDEAVG